MLYCRFLDTLFYFCILRQPKHGPPLILNLIAQSMGYVCHGRPIYHVILTLTPCDIKQATVLLLVADSIFPEVLGIMKTMTN